MGFWFSAYAPLALLFGYLLGSIPFGLLLTQAAGMDDVRKIGSGNIGATNVLRTGRKGLAAATLALICSRVRWPCCWCTRSPSASWRSMPTSCPMWRVSAPSSGTSIRSGCALPAARASPPSSACCWASISRLPSSSAWSGRQVAATTRYSSLAALSATVAVVLFYIAFGQAGLLFILIMAILIFLKHEGNIRRLLAGEESRIGAKS
jgi:glycerol-3-phosphate acyltransferase PlsY